LGGNAKTPIRIAAGAECVYVDLIRNPEAYTGFSGKNARRVWRSIYEENCFNTVNLPPDEEREGSAWGQSPSPLVQPTCLEERIFYRILSGMHASIAVHLSSRYTKGEAGNWVHFRSSGSSTRAFGRLPCFCFLLQLFTRFLTTHCWHSAWATTRSVSRTYTLPTCSSFAPW